MSPGGWIRKQERGDKGLNHGGETDKVEARASPGGRTEGLCSLDVRGSKEQDGSVTRKGVSSGRERRTSRLACPPGLVRNREPLRASQAEGASWTSSPVHAAVGYKWRSGGGRWDEGALESGRAWPTAHADQAVLGTLRNDMFVKKSVEPPSLETAPSSVG